MIILILGGTGSGKTLSAIREIITKNQFALTNFKLKHIKNYHRIKFADIIVKGDKEEKEKDYVNWRFWDNIRKEHKNYSIYLDEIHNVIHSRRSMSTVNILMSKWVSQIRKILADNERNHLYLISQTARKIDIDFRDLAQVIIKCRKKGKNSFLQYYFNGINNYETGRYVRPIKWFKGKKFYKFYDTLDLVSFEDGEEFI